MIQQLTTPTSTTIRGYNETMHYNDETCRWEGNNGDLQRFDSMNCGPGYQTYTSHTGPHGFLSHSTQNSTTGNGGKTPGLIAFISPNEIKVVGDMVFDPARMRWISIREEEEEDPFDGLEDMDVTMDADAQFQRYGKRHLPGFVDQNHHAQQQELYEREDDDYGFEEDDGVYTDMYEDAFDEEFDYDELHPNTYQNNNFNPQNLRVFMNHDTCSRSQSRPKSPPPPAHQTLLQGFYQNDGRAVNSMYELSSTASSTSFQADMQPATGSGPIFAPTSPSRKFRSIKRQPMRHNHNNNGDFVVGKEFDISEEAQKKLKQYQERWQYRVEGWFSPGTNDNMDKQHLWELRRMVMKR